MNDFMKTFVALMDLKNLCLNCSTGSVVNTRPIRPTAPF